MITTEQPTLTEDRLATLEADLTLRHTTVRWLAHEAAYPGMGALSMFTPIQHERDAATLVEIADLVAELEENLPDDECLPYFRWVRDELQEALR